MRPKNVILLEINIIATSFNDVDLLYYLLFDAFARRLGVWCTMVAVERCWPPSFSLAPSCLIFLRSVCVFASTWPEALRPFLGRVVNMEVSQEWSTVPLLSPPFPPFSSFFSSSPPLPFRGSKKSTRWHER